MDDIEGNVYFFALNKAIENNWGDEQNKELSKQIKDDLEDKDLLDYKNRLRTIKSGVNNNDESLHWLSFVINKSQEIKDEIISNLVAHKNLDRNIAENSLNDLNDLIIEFKNKFDHIGSIVDSFVRQDEENRQKELPVLKKNLKNAIDFFRPKPEMIKMKKVIYLPTNPLEKIQSGNGIDAGENFYINSEHGNKNNQIHEFLHSIINPMTEKINFSPEEERKILELARERLVKHYVYPNSIITEELIRAYKTGFIQENKPSLENFKKALLKTPKDELEQILKIEKEKEGAAMAKNAEDLLESDDIMEKYYIKYAQDKLAERIWKFYEDYNKNRDDSENFEDYLLNNYKRILT